MRRLFSAMSRWSLVTEISCAPTTPPKPAIPTEPAMTATTMTGEMRIQAPRRDNATLPFGPASRPEGYRDVTVLASVPGVWHPVPDAKHLLPKHLLPKHLLPKHLLGDTEALEAERLDRVAPHQQVPLPVVEPGLV